MTALVLIVPAFLFHVAPRFPGSLAGGVTGKAAALLFVSLLSYWIAKRIPWVKERTKNTVSVGVPAERSTFTRAPSARCSASCIQVISS